MGTTGGAFVAGATGYVGQQVTVQLCRAGIPTVAHVRPDSARLAEWRDRFAAMGAQVDETPWVPDAMADAMRRLRPDRVFCLVGTTRARMRESSRAGRDPDEASYRAVDFGLTALLAGAAARAGIAPRFVYLSAMGAGPSAKGAYMHWRTKAEEAAVASGLPYTLVRPALVTGADRDEHRAGERVAHAALEGVLGLSRALGVSGPWQRYRSIDAASLARELIRLSGAPEAANRVVERRELKDGESA